MRPILITMAVAFNSIPCSRENPKILRVANAEVVGDLLAVLVPVSGHVVAHKGQDRGAEILETRVAFVGVTGLCTAPHTRSIGLRCGQ